MNWSHYALLAALAYGVLNFLYKVAAQRGLSGSRLVNKAALTVVLWSTILLWWGDHSLADWKTILIYAFFNSSFFVLNAVSKVRALKNIPTSYFFTLSKMSLIIVLILSLTVLGEMPAPKQWGGILCIFAIIFLVAADSRKDKRDIVNLKQGLIFAGLVAIGNGFSVFVGKLASTAVDRMAYIFFSYIITATYTGTMSRVGKAPRHEHLMTYILGALIGTLNFWGYVGVLKAFSTGPLSLVQSLSSIAIIIPILLSVLFLKESFNIKKFFMIVLALAATLLVKA